MINVKKIKQDFPIFKHNPNLVYLDSTATSLKPKVMVDKLVEYYEKYSANIFRGVYKISEKATEEYERTREIVAGFINAKNSREIIFTRNTTESLNLVAYSLGRQIINKGDELVTTIMEHHSNFVPWQQLAFEVGGIFKVMGIDYEGYLSLNSDKLKMKNYNQKNMKDNLEQIINKKTKILALTYISNVLGTINPVHEIIRYAKQINPKIITVVDAAQAAPHMKIDVQDLGCDFITFSSHKMFGPTGVGVLWGKLELLEQMFAFQYGGEMVTEVTLGKTTFKESPHKFEAGTPDIGSVIAFKEAINYLQSLGWESIKEHEKELTKYCLRRLETEFQQKIHIIGPGFQDRAGIVAFTFSRYHPHDIAQILDENNICIRAGHHCAMPLHQRLGISVSARASFYIYNDKQDIDKLIEKLKKVEKIL